MSNEPNNSPPRRSRRIAGLGPPSEARSQNETTVKATSRTNDENSSGRRLATTRRTVNRRTAATAHQNTQPSVSDAVATRSRSTPTTFIPYRVHLDRNITVLPVKGESFCECPKQGRDLECTCGEEDNSLEWSWDDGSKSLWTRLSDENRNVRFHVDYSCGTAAVKGTQAMNDRQYFWEIKMTTPVYGTDMMIGVGTGDVDMNAYTHTFCSLLGKDGDSWGLSYLGRLHHKGDVSQYGSKFGQGSIIGVHLDMWHGTLSFYKNRKPLGVAYRGLSGKTLYPMVSSTAARSGMKVIKASSFRTSLQFMCCQVLRNTVPTEMDVIEALNMPPGLSAFLANNLSWLLRSQELTDNRKPVKRNWNDIDVKPSCSSTSDESEPPPKR